MNTMKSHEQEVAETILAQLGGKGFIVCTGSKNFACGKDEKGNPYLRFKLCDLRPYLPGKKVRPNLCRITLDEGADTYTVKFEYFKDQTVRFNHKTFETKVIPGKRETTYEKSDVYCDELQNVFEQQTGLILDLCRVRFG